MAVLVPLLSTTQEEGLVELIEQVLDTQNLAIAAGSGNTNTKVPEIIDSYRADLKNGFLTVSCTFAIYTDKNPQGNAVMRVRVVYT